MRMQGSDKSEVVASKSHYPKEVVDMINGWMLRLRSENKTGDKHLAQGA